MDTSRIIALAKEQGKTVTYLCQLMGKSRYYLRDVRNKGFNIPYDSLEILADDLGTTAEYLNWETDDSTNGAADSAKKQFILSFDEERLLEDYRSLNEQGQEWIRQSMVAALNTYKKADRSADMEITKVG